MISLLNMMVVSDPCSGAPTLTVGTPALQSSGDCGLLDGLVCRTLISTSSALDPGAKIQYRYSWDTNSSTVPSGSWTDFSGYSGTSTNLDITPMTNVGGYPGPFARFSGANLIGTVYFKVEVQLLGTDSSTVCDGPDVSSTLTVTSVYSCVE